MHAEAPERFAAEAGVTAPGGHAAEPAQPDLLQMSDWLDAADWSADALAQALPGIVEQAATLSPQARNGWQAGLRLAWSRQGWGMSTRVRQQLLKLAHGWDDWPLVIAVGERLAQQDRGDRAVRVMLATAYWHQGDAGYALSVLHRLLMERPGDRAAYALYRDIDAWCEYRFDYPLIDDTVSADGELRLEPLGEHHVRDFAWQYHDPAIAELCCLPQFDSDSAWIDWLRDTHGYGDQLLFAVLHRDWGLVGSVSLILHRGAGFFYYWIGPGFQGNGIGPRAVAMMLAAAHQNLGMHACYAKAYADNYPSRRGLIKLGFAPMPVVPEPPNDNERFYRAGAGLAEHAAVEQLRVLLADMGSEVCVRQRTLRLAMDTRSRPSLAPRRADQQPSR